MKKGPAVNGVFFRFLSESRLIKQAGNAGFVRDAVQGFRHQWCHRYGV